MASTQCGFCGKGTSFTASEQSVAGSKYRIVFIKCSTCGAVAGTMDNITTNEVWDDIQKIKKQMGIR